MTTTGKFIHPGDIVVVKDHHLKKDGLPSGSRVAVAWMKALPLSEKDPYTQRIKLFVQKVRDDNIPDPDSPIFVIDPHSVKLEPKVVDETSTD